LLRFGNGVIGSIDNSRRAVYGYDQRVELFGSQGMLTTANRFESSAVISDAHSVHRDLPFNFFMQRYQESYLEEMSAFVECVLEDRKPPVTGADGRAAAVLAVAAQRSAHEKRMVRVDEVDL